MWGQILTLKEQRLFRHLNTPQKIQTYISSLPFNFSIHGDTISSPRVTIRQQKAHCLEGALLAAAILWFHGKKPILLDLRSSQEDDDHVVTLFQDHGHWGAISKTNHAVLRYRDPIYRNVRELAMSYVHEYFLNSTGKKTLRDFSRPFSLARYGTRWVTSEENLWSIAEDLDDSPHYMCVPKGVRLRPADAVERRAGGITEWKKKA